MFEDFLCDRADIYPMKRNTANRTVKDQAANTAKPTLTDIPCRVHGEKIFFAPDMTLHVGDVVEIPEDKTRYEVTEERQTRSMHGIHHRTYMVKKRVTQ